MLRPRKRLAIVALTAGLLALGATALLVQRTARRAPPESGPHPAAVATAEARPDPDPRFPTDEQRTRYYGAVVKGEQKALDVVEAALRKARAEGGDRTQIGKLESLRASYRERLDRHRAKLGL
jgi:hypothetical protein